MLDYALIDFGNGRKLERFGAVTVDRPEVLAQGPPSLSAMEWSALADGRFEEDKNAKGKWQVKAKFPETWPCTFGPKADWKVICKTGPYKHLGIFPEQQKHWAYLQKHLKRGDKYLNLFAYTGAASLAAAKTGASVYHVEASKSVVNWAAENARQSDVSDIHWVCDDALKFAERELKRGHRYKGISMDPPIYGRAKGGTRWRLEDKLEGLVETASNLLVPGGFLVLNTYSPVIDLNEMVKLCQKMGFAHNEAGWLSVNTADGRRLALSKYCFAQLKKKR